MGEIWAHCPTCEFDVAADDDVHEVDVVWSQGQAFATVVACYAYPPVP